jgi:hypothetical protein
VSKRFGIPPVVVCLEPSSARDADKAADNDCGVQKPRLVTARCQVASRVLPRCLRKRVKDIAFSKQVLGTCSYIFLRNSHVLSGLLCYQAVTILPLRFPAVGTAERQKLQADYQTLPLCRCDKITMDVKCHFECNMAMNCDVEELK